MSTKNKKDLKLVKGDNISSDIAPEPSLEATATGSLITHSWWIDTVTNESWAYQNDSFTDEEAKSIISIGTNANTAESAKGIVNFETGKSDISWIRSDIESNRWIFQRLAGLLKSLNDQFFNLDIDYIENVQFVKLEADDNGFFEKHVDTLYKSTGTRKLSFTVLLSNESEYEGGEVILHTNSAPSVLPKIKNNLLVFPSYTLKEISKVTSGVRYSLSGWVIGPKFK